ncbi:metallophosphoesterase family protein [Nonomuraea sp. B12E4]|uniref:metallophosphoesterase family protein n=1 Tax=Nonomuraea sp. B12E4 TaxID=3153564 RepID=UPI00325F8051
MQRTIIVGDVHGCFEELLDLLERVGLCPGDVLVSVGDLVDRGPAPGEVVRFFRERPNSVVVMGNHERKHVRGIFSYAQEITRLQLGEGYAEAVAWMGTLPYFFENEQVRVVHAAMVPGVALAEQRQDVLCGSTSGERELARLFPDGFWHDRYSEDKPVVFGHHVTGPEPMIRGGRVFGLDTGACHGGNLTALCVPGFTVHAVRARADHWSVTRRRWQLPVAKARPWPDLTWPELEAAVERLSARSGAGTREWLEQVGAWAARVRALLPAVAAAAERLAGELTTAGLRAHPAAGLLFQAREGRLGEAGLARRCSTPRRTMDVAAALGVAVPSFPR